MNLFMAYMTGSGVQIFSIMFTGYMLYGPMTTLLATNKTFEPYEHPGESLLMAKLVYIALNLAILGIGVWKAYGMGKFEADCWIADMFGSRCRIVANNRV
jgi:hypothetical protein